MKSNVVFAFLLGATVALGSAVAVLSLNPATSAHAAEAGRGNLFGMMGTGYQGQSRDTLFLIDADTQRIAIYDYKNSRLTVTAVRNVKWDMKFEEFPGRNQTPSVEDMRKEILKAEGKKD